jgi:hypothetical protein
MYSSFIGMPFRVTYKINSLHNSSYALLLQETVSEVVEEKLDTEAPKTEEGKAPKFISTLQKVYPSRDGELIRYSNMKYHFQDI